jgi:acetoacetyl-[acyl-carrier protein] synthase
MKSIRRLPVICGYGGINSAGRSAFDLAYKRLVFNLLSQEEKNEVILDLSNMTDGLTNEENILANTLVRKIDKDKYDPDGLMTGKMNVNAAGQFPAGFDPGSFYKSRQHPVGLETTLFGVSDTLGFAGINWDEDIKPTVDPSRVGVFAGPAIGQLDSFGLGGLMQSRLKGKRASSKHLSMSLLEMSADFINAYILGSVGVTGANAGACATFLYNLDLLINGIKEDRLDIGIAGSAEAPINPEVTDGFVATTGIADDKKILAMQERNGDDSEIDYSRACRPFGDNAGLILGEAAQFVLVASLEKAFELGLEIYALAPGIKINADGIKKSISSPGIGNYITMASAVNETKQFSDDLNKSFVIAHGTGTFQNRSTESHVLSSVASGMELNEWKITGLKGALGHTMGPAAGDELMTAIGFWKHGFIPGINTTKKLAEDVYKNNLNFILEDAEKDKESIDAIYLNAKGFGGNNASAGIISPKIAIDLAKEEFSKNEHLKYQQNKEKVLESSLNYQESCKKGDYRVIYRFNEEVLEGLEDIEISEEGIKLKGFKTPINFN